MNPIGITLDFIEKIEGLFCSVLYTERCVSFPGNACPLNGLHEGFLEQKVNNHEGQDGQQRPGQPDGLVEGAAHGGVVVAWIQFVKGVNKGGQADGKGARGCAGKQRELHCFIPEPDKGKQESDRDGRDRHRDGNPDKNPQAAGAVNHRRLVQRLGVAAEELIEYQQKQRAFDPLAAQGGDEGRPDGSHHLVAIEQHVSGDERDR